ncbi:glycosyltransferase family 1 protein [Halalkalibacterium halodurans]|uniref:glycosyltransferase family 4 protein n=1 Tax=Halalkalibacterium halodurans TaxID=86665 RepID=UPI00308462E2
MMRIALFTDTYIPQVNGVARTMKRLVDHLEKRQVEYALYMPETIEKLDRFESNIHTFASLPFFLYPECRIALPNVFKLRQQLTSFQPDLLHIATPFNVGLSGLQHGKKYGIPMVGSYHTHFDHYLHYYKLQFMSAWLWKYVKWFHQPFERTFVPSVETMRHLQKHGFQRLALWTRGVDCERFHPKQRHRSYASNLLPKDKAVLLYVGRLAPEKDLATLVAIMAQLPQELNEKIQWMIVGDGPSLPEMKKQCPTNVTFTGYLKGEELAAAYASADLFVFPSATETFGNVVLESFASGTPAIVADRGGVTEIVEHGKSGMICKAGDVHSFIQAIEHLLMNRSKRAEMGYEARQYALTQSWERIFDDLLEQYEQVIFHHKKRHLA